MSDTKAKRPEPQAAAPSDTPVAAASGPTPAPTPPAAPAAAETTVPAIIAHRGKAMGEETLAYGQKALSAIAESQAAMARGLEALALEVTGLTRTAVAAAGDSATAMLGARTVAEAVEVQIGFARRSFEAAASGSARLSELCLKLVGDASRPLIAPVTAPGAGADADHGGFRRL